MKNWIDWTWSTIIFSTRACKTWTFAILAFFYLIWTYWNSYIRTLFETFVVPKELRLATLSTFIWFWYTFFAIQGAGLTHLIHFGWICTRRTTWIAFHIIRVEKRGLRVFHTWTTIGSIEYACIAWIRAFLANVQRVLVVTCWACFSTSFTIKIKRIRYW